MSFAQQLIAEGIAEGIEKGAIIGSIQQLQELLGITIESNQLLSKKEMQELKMLNAQLKQQFKQKLS